MNRLKNRQTYKKTDYKKQTDNENRHTNKQTEKKQNTIQIGNQTEENKL